MRLPSSRSFSALERQLSREIMGADQKPKIEYLRAGAILVEQGRAGQELFLLLDGVVAAEVDGQVVAELGPGVLLGERAALEGGRRTATLRAVTACRVAVAYAEQLKLEHLTELARGHRHEQE